MKIVSFMCVYNDHEYLDQAIESFKHYPDKLFIIEGSWQSSQKFDASPRSNQLVYDVLDKHVDNKRVFLVQANEPREREQRQIGLEIAKKEDADWCHMLDADEVYTEQSLRFIKANLQNAQSDILGYRLQSYNFINSFKRWYNGDYMRIYRVTPEATFVMDNDVQWPDKQGMIVRLPGKSFYHYNYVRRNVESFWLKLKYQNDQDPTLWKRMVESGEYDEKDGIYTIPKDCSTFEFHGKHPAIMRNHPYFQQDVFGDGELNYGN